MCFSASASFGASAVVAVAGVVSIKKIETKTQVMFASIPIIFSLQQLIEGFVWITLTNDDYHQWKNIPVAMFLLLAQVLWPVWVPLSILLIEKDSRRRIALKVLVGMSVILAPFQAYRLFFYPFDATITPYHIHYSLDFSIPYFGPILNVFYFLTTMIPPFLSNSRRVVTLGFFNLASFLITVIFFEKNVISIWCFFAALISWEVVLVMKEFNKNSRLGSGSIA